MSLSHVSSQREALAQGHLKRWGSRRTRTLTLWVSFISLLLSTPSFSLRCCPSQHGWLALETLTPEIEKQLKSKHIDILKTFQGHLSFQCAPLDNPHSGTTCREREWYEEEKKFFITDFPHHHEEKLKALKAI